MSFPFKDCTRRKLQLGQHYMIWWRNKPVKIKLVKVTPKGYNLLDVETNKCILYPHLYPSKKPDDQVDGHFVFYIRNWINALIGQTLS